MLLIIVEIREKNIKGAPTPRLKDKKFNTFAENLGPDIVSVKRVMVNEGSLGITIIPKKNPNKRALNKGILVVVIDVNLFKLRLNINKKATKNKIIKAMGEATPVAIFKETFRIVVKTNPTSSINRIIPKLTIRPDKMSVFLFGLLDNWPER